MDKLTLKTAIGMRSWRDGVAREQAHADGFALDFVEVSPIHRAFAPMARTQAYDVSEMAIVTALQAFAYGKPLLVLPVTIAARFQHGCLITRRADRPITVADLPGRRVAVRAYTQTTGVWVRGILEDSYGIKAPDIQWMTQEGAHVAEYQDPPWVQRLPEAALVDLLRDGTVDAAILGNDLPDDPDLVPVIPEPKQAAEAWFQRFGVVPINHAMVIRRDVAKAHPQVLREFWAMLKRAKPASKPGPDMSAIGVAANRTALEHVIAYCDQQALLPRKITVDELFAETLALLGED